MKPEIQELIDISRWYGQKKEYVIAGGGNTSFKDEKHLWIKASGINLGNIDENGFCVLDRKKLNDIPNSNYYFDGSIDFAMIDAPLVSLPDNPLLQPAGAPWPTSVPSTSSGPSPSCC